MKFPKKDTVYTFNDMLIKLNLPDSPFLQFVYNDTECIIQNSHVSDNALLCIPGMRESLWCYEKTTREHIPLFWYLNDNVDILTLVDIHEVEDGSYWVTPKGYPRAVI